MYAENLEAGGGGYRRLFDPRRTYKRLIYRRKSSWPICSIIWKADGRRLWAKSGAQLCYRKNKRQRALCAHGQQHAGQRAVYDAAAVSAKNQLLFAGTRAD